MGIFGKKKRDPRAELEALLGDYEVPSMSSTVMRLLSLLRDPDTPMAEIASQVEMDPGLTVRILRLINSAAFGLLTEVSNLQHAVSLLGRSRLESLVLAVASADALPDNMDCMETRKFWGAAARRATLARVVAQQLHAATQAESFTAGLLQDIAVPLIARTNPEGYAEILRRLNDEPGAKLDQMERDFLGFDHATIGALMAEDWKLPEYLVHAIGGHHGNGGAPSVDPAVRLVSLVMYSPENDGRDELVEAAQNEFGIEEGLIQEMIDRSFAEAEEVAGMFFS
jgi:HD-like signal output (HDOD) protein